MYSSHSRHVDANNTEVLHLLGREPRPNQVNTRAKPAVLWTTFFKPDVAASLKLCHQPVNILLRHFINFLFQSVIDRV